MVCRGRIKRKAQVSDFSQVYRGLKSLIYCMGLSSYYALNLSKVGMALVPVSPSKGGWALVIGSHRKRSIATDHS